MLDLKTYSSCIPEILCLIDSKNFSSIILVLFFSQKVSLFKCVAMLKSVKQNFKFG